MKIIVYNCFVLVLAYYGYRCYNVYEAFIEENKESIGRLEGMDAILKKNQKDLETTIKNGRELDSKKLQYNKVVEQIQEMEKQLPSQILDIENLDMINSLAEKQNIQNIFLSPGNEDRRGFFYAKRYNFKASATFVQILVFLENLRNNPRLLNVTGLNISVRDSSQRGRFKIVEVDAIIESYRYASESVDNADNIEQRIKRQHST